VKTKKLRDDEDGAGVHVACGEISYNRPSLSLASKLSCITCPSNDVTGSGVAAEFAGKRGRGDAN
jgi:hypothetical protein